MTIALDRQTKQQSQKMLCFYENTSRKMQNAKICNVKNQYWERAVFPGERLFFEAVPEAELEIHQHQENGDVRCESFSCKHFKVKVVDKELIGQNTSN
jgi:hypothetical protein